MTNKTSLFLLLIILQACISCNKPPQELSIMSFNIRYDNPNDGINSWTDHDRKKIALSVIKKYHPDILGIQEALYNQVTDISSFLKDYDWIGVGRDDGKLKGEFAPIFYNKTLFKVVDWGYFWLSETPEKPSLGWDARCCNRIATWAHLKGAKDVVVFNTHFDHEGTLAQEESSKLLLKKIAEIAQEIPVIVTGDLNVTPNSKPVSLLKSQLTDTYIKTNPEGTFNGFNDTLLLDKRIDYILTNKHFKTLAFTIINDKVNARFPSDHFPVMALLTIN